MSSIPAAILIDLDGTICDTDASVQAGVDAACAEARRILGVDDSAWRAANSEAARSEWSANAQLWMDGGISSLDLSLRIYERTLIAVRADPDLSLDFVKAHADAARLALRRYDDVAGFLDAAKQAGIMLALVTNGASDTQRTTLEALSLDETFDAVVVSSEHGVSKPDAAAFGIALTALGVDPRRAWHVGDSLESDVAGALGAGMSAVWLNRLRRERSVEQPTPSVEVTSLAELIPHFA